MFGWFKKQPGQSVGDIVGKFEKAGIRFTSADARDTALRGVVDYEEMGANTAESILCAIGDEQMDEDTFEQLPWLSNDAWHFDYEAIEDHGAYKSIVENCVRISGAALEITDLSDFVDIEDGQAWVEFTHRGNPMKLNLTVDDDWADPKLFVMLNGILKSDGSDRRFAQHDLGQDCLIVCRTASEISELNKLAGLKFRQLEG